MDDLFTYGLYLGFDKETVKDAAHDIFCKLSEDESRLDDVSEIKFYLFRSLKNRLFDIHKQRKRYMNQEMTASTMSELPFHMAVDVEELMIEKEEQSQIKKEIEQMLSMLTDRQREIIYLRYVQEYDYAQIAELLHISIHGCRKLVSKAIQNLRERLSLLVTLLIIT